MMTENRKQDLKTVLKTRIPDCKISILEVSKNNGITKTGVSIQEKDKNIAPVYYIDFLLERGYTDSEIVDWILLQQSQNKELESSFNSVTSSIQNYEDIKNQLCIELINRERNTKLFESVPYKPFLDLALIVVILLDSEERARASIKVTNSLLTLWGVDFEEVFSYALNQFMNLQDEQIVPMQDVCNRLNSPLEVEVPFYIITNQNLVNGATQIVKRDILERLAEQLHSDLYIIPSSTHECLALPYDACMSEEYFNQMIQEVNELQVMPEEILSDHVYLFKRDAGWYNY